MPLFANLPPAFGGVKTRRRLATSGDGCAQARAADGEKQRDRYRGKDEPAGHLQGCNAGKNYGG